tara:strand:+ start:20542 stop:20643 length:102 start_codon:yes stop_codon:yes gene_type:complete
VCGEQGWIFLALFFFVLTPFLFIDMGYVSQQGG